MIYIVEGADKSGKSTLIKAFTEQHARSLVLKLSSDFKPKYGDKEELHNLSVAYNELFNQARALSYDQGFDVIFDRAYPSEIVYSIKRDYDAFKHNHWWELDRGLAASGFCKLIYCSVPDEINKDRMQTEKEEYLKQDELTLIKARYKEFLAKTKLTVIELDTTQDPQLNATYML